MRDLALSVLAAISLKADDIGLPNTTTNIGDGITKVVGILIYLIGGLSIIFIMVGGIQMAASAGNSNRFAQGRETIIYAVVGLVVAIGAFAIVSFVSGRL